MFSFLPLPASEYELFDRLIVRIDALAMQETFAEPRVGQCMQQVKDSKHAAPLVGFFLCTEWDIFILGRKLANPFE